MRKLISIALLLATLVGCAGFLASAGVRIRVHLLGLKVAGRLPGVTRWELYSLLRPGAGFDLVALRQTRNPFASLKAPSVLEVDSAAGRATFESKCAQCHGRKGEGISGPPLASWNRKHGTTDWSAYRVIQDGVAGTAMRPSGLSFDDSWRVLAYINGLSTGTATETDTPARKLAPVSASDLANAEASTSEWLMYAGGWSGRRNKDVPGLTAATVGKMRLAWAFQLPRDPATSQSTPIAARGLLIVTTAVDVIALDQADGSVVWRFHRDLPVEVKVCCSRANRGVGISGDLVFVGTLDAYLFALDLATGQVRWQVRVADAESGYSITGAPFPVDGRIVVGVAGGEFGVRGFLDCYEAATGRRIWRYHTVPALGEPGSESWGGAIPAGGPTWVPGAYDPASQTLFWGVGNPSPDFAADVRPGDNLHTNSAIALDFNTGTLKWAFQFTPNDSHDWDAAQTPVLADATIGGRKRPVVLWANRNAYFYVLDRATGEFLRATEFARQTWNDGFDSAGRPRPRASALPTAEGSIVYPGVGGATNWWPATYSERLGLMFVSSKDDGSIFFRDRSLVHESAAFLGGRTQPVPGEPHSNAVVAIDAATGAIRWKTTSPEHQTAAMGGLLSIADRLVIGGQSNTFFALDARTGTRLWQSNLGAPIYGAPVTFRSGSSARVSVTAGAVLFVFEVPGS